MTSPVSGWCADGPRLTFHDELSLSGVWSCLAASPANKKLNNINCNRSEICIKSGLELLCNDVGSAVGGNYSPTVPSPPPIPPWPGQTEGWGCRRPCSVKERKQPFSRPMVEASAPSEIELKQPLVIRTPPLSLRGSDWTFGRTGPPSLTLPLFVLVVCRPDWPDCWLIASQFEVVQVAGIKAQQCCPPTHIFTLQFVLKRFPLSSDFLYFSDQATETSPVLLSPVC